MPEPKKEEEGDCPPCRLAVGAGMALNVCESVLKDKVDCKQLNEDFTEGRINEEQLFDKLGDIAVKAGAPHIKEDLDEIRRLAKGEVV